MSFVDKKSLLPGGSKIIGQTGSIQMIVVLRERAVCGAAPGPAGETLTPLWGWGREGDPESVLGPESAGLNKTEPEKCGGGRQSKNTAPFTRTVIHPYLTTKNPNSGMRLSSHRVWDTNWEPVKQVSWTSCW